MVFFKSVGTRLANYYFNPEILGVLVLMFIPSCMKTMVPAEIAPD